jgi:RNA polymerase sigma factor (sigma-70 family)
VASGSAEEYTADGTHRARKTNRGHGPYRGGLHGLATAPDDDAAGNSYAEFYVEHAPAARRLALSLVPRDVADDIVAEAFTRVLGAIRAGGGPDVAFRSYLLAAVRNLASDWQRATHRTAVVGDLDIKDRDAERSGPLGRPTSGVEAQAEARAEARLVASAFGRLPVRWRAVLWQLEVEGKAPTAVAPMFGLSANGVSALAMRAREGLRQAYLQEHVGANIPPSCRVYTAMLGAGARGRLSRRRQLAMHEHLQQCAACRDLFAELTELNSRLGSILSPAALAGASAALAAGRRAVVTRAWHTGAWRLWRVHPVTAATGAAAGMAAAGGMVLAVSLAPAAGSPAQHVAVRAAASPAALTTFAPAVRGPRAGGGARSPGRAAPLSGATSPGRTSGTAGTGVSGMANGTSNLGSTVGATTINSGGTTGNSGGTTGNLGGTVGSTAGNLGSTVGGTVSNLGGTVGGTVSNLGGTVGGTAGNLGGTTGNPGGAMGNLGGTVGGTAGNLGNTTGNPGGTVGGTTNNLGSVVGKNANGPALPRLP